MTVFYLKVARVNDFFNEARTRLKYFKNHKISDKLFCICSAHEFLGVAWGVNSVKNRSPHFLSAKIFSIAD
ncbi:MAG: hypothetical protein JXR70_13070 [Spirochaetales bacterium]|nr:hypothetical protein [Spirochaetales bacterium]